MKPEKDITGAAAGADAREADAAQTQINGREVPASAAEPQQNTREGEGAAAAGTAGGARERDLAAEFEELIRGEYRDAFSARVKEILVRRFREKAAESSGAPDRPEDEKEFPAADYADEAEELARELKGFSLERELENPDFAKLVRAGVSLGAAYEAVHREAIFPERLRAAVESETERVWRELHATRSRVSEVGRTRMNAPARPVSRLTAKEREELEQRAMRGEKIIL